jgi:hypothetical protein
MPPEYFGGFGGKRLGSLIKDVAIVVSKPLCSDFFYEKTCRIENPFA